MKKLILLLLTASAFATTTVTGNIKTLGTTAIGSGTFVRFWLRGCGGNQPRINGTGVVAPSQGGVFFFDFQGNSSGVISGTLYSTRDATGLLGGDIECGGSKTAVWYGMQVFLSGKGAPEVAVVAKNGATLDVSNVTPITMNPVVTAPTGDSTYLRLDAGNSPVTGTPTFNTSLCNLKGPLDVVACYAADPTGVADSTTALNNAFSAASDAPRFIPAGIYKISGTLNIDTRYKVYGAPGSGSGPNNTIIQAAVGFSGTMANIVSTAAQSTTVLGGMDGMMFDCAAHASIGVLYGGGGGSLTTYGYQTQNSEFHNCNTAGAEVGAQAWLLNWVNVSFQGNGGDGLIINDAANMGENLNCHSCGFLNNTGNGLTMGPATLAQHDFHCFSCSFDVNGGWAIQNQTATTGDSLVDLEGSYIFTHQKWISNFGRMTINGSFFNDGSNSGTLGYLIDNEGLMQAFGGRWVNSGGGTVFNGSQSGTTNCYSIPSIPNNTCNSWIDGASGNALFGGVTLGGNLSLAAKTFGTLPSAASFPGAVYYITDSTNIAAEGQNCAGGSSTKALAFSNGSAWKCF